jgi:DNA helicase-2/ATP-dependent DNA helicase PcrA
LLIVMDAFAASPDLLANLTDAQRAAVTHVEGPLLILAGPGSGKTRVITHRLAYLLEQGVSARQMVALTFTNKAADEMKARLARLAPNQHVWMGTFHRFCARLLRQYGNMVGLAENYTIYDTDDQAKQLDLAIADLGIELTHATPAAISSAISNAKNQLVRADQYVPKPGSTVGSLVAKIYPAYQKRLLAANAVDFDDLLLHTATLLRENNELRAALDATYRYIMVDEYQDTNFAQYAIIRALSVDHPNLAVTGDPDQSIYGWRGANLSNILDFERDYPSVRVVKLEQNYRSTKSILRVADGLIRHNRRRKEKRLFTENAEGDLPRLMAYPSQRDESDHIAERIAHDVRAGTRRPRDFAVFYRMNALSRQLEQSFIEHGLPYQIVKGLEFYQRKEIKDVLAYLHVLNNPAVDVPLLRIINTPTRGIGKATIEKLREHATRNSITLLDACRESGLVESIGKKSAVSVAKFVAIIDELRSYVHDPLEAIIGRVLSVSGYRETLVNSETEEDQERLANIEELLTAGREFDAQHPEGGTLEQFLEHSSLVADTDAFADEADKVTLMTLHAAKGLEFPCVFIIAAEQGILPHERSKDHPDREEEERRLLFVGITRAEEELQISYAHYRNFRGRLWPTVPSPFLMDLPRGEMESYEATARARPREETWDEDSGDDSFDPSSFDDDAVQAAPDDEQVIEASTGAPRGKVEVAATFSALRTAADMLADQSRRRFSPNVFTQGMIVKHPEYGYGEIITLAGVGPKRIASVKFYDHAEEKKFRLLHSPLEPAEE